MLLPLRLEPLLAAVAPPLCWSCGAGARPHEPLCRRCRAQLRFLPPEPVALAGIPTWSAVAYEGPARALVRGLKYRGAAGLAGTLAAYVAASAPEGLLSRTSPNGPFLIPVPAAAARARRRGFDQASLLAQALGDRVGLPLARCLERPGWSQPQVGRGRSARLSAPTGTVRIRAGAPVPAEGLLVDDVITTGATLAACAATLRAAGCEHVAAVSYARTLGR